VWRMYNSTLNLKTIVPWACIQNREMCRLLLYPIPENLFPLAVGFFKGWTEVPHPLYKDTSIKVYEKFVL
jgi:hypothetical protein